MLIYILIIIVITQTHSIHTDHSHSRIVRHKTEYKVNISMVNDDIEMIDKDNERIQISNTTSILSKLYKKKFHKTLHNRSLDTKQDSADVRSKMYQNNSSIRSNRSEAANSEKKWKRRERTHHILEIHDNTTESEELKILPRIAREISADRMWSIVQIWLIIYFVLAIPLWCTIGRCCCCLVCKCFKAQETIREAKLYAMWNPPGMLRKSAGDVIYTPSQKEKEAYEELEHLIRTL